ncbi:hypothetical protein [Thalassotalea agarivorans]|uniref:Uncharacterized protein n=1 Tax=Thalassotalea agarivorans TaxID=349064 RepID=A0A1I0DFN7_THASX|nr:hypothetical protein [Thalassotalea agarivorans]SET31102.1 hypothetical protein SAMN05660429_01494 [Thalassotalea agarivorans]
MERLNALQGVSILRVLSLTILMLLVSFSVRSSSDDFVINLTPDASDSCKVSLSNSEGNDCDANQCGSDNACICLAKGDHVKWKMPEGNHTKFKLKFTTDNPLKDNCGKNFKKDKHKCVVKSDVSVGQVFVYDVVMEGCGQGTDPRIIIRSRN